MTATYKVIGKVTRPKPKHLLGQYDVPVDALDLQETLTLLEIAEAALDRIDPLNITSRDTAEQRDFGRAMLNSQLALIFSWKRTVRRNIQKYLAR